jgi:hypothetical protein
MIRLTPYRLAVTAGVLIVLSAPLIGLLRATAQEDAPPIYYWVTLAAADRTARNAVTEAGIAIDALRSDGVTAIVDARGLERLLAQGLVPLSVQPLDFPPVDSAYHNYAELQTVVHQIAAAHPDITRLYTSGLSLEGRGILAVKISDAPDGDDPTEPAVLFVALHHAREHLTVEMALEVIRLFTGGYGIDPALTNLVNTREIWVLPNVNPDGSEYDIGGGVYWWWRKNRRPNADGSIGVDLNRNYGYRWGGQGSSGLPADDTYRGPAPFSEPETQAVRDFVLAHPDISAAISFHTFGELILHPYGYTGVDLPPDMTLEDLYTFRALANQMAASNGYTPLQSSDLYITSGDTVDWLYGERGIFAFTFEMYPTSSPPGFYPPADAIEREVQRNHAAIAYLAAVADNPRKAIGMGGDVTAPAVDISVTASLVTVGQTVTATATVSDDMEVTLVAWCVDGQTVAMQAAGPFDLTWTPEPGAHGLQAMAFDAGGNVGVSLPITVTARSVTPRSLWLPMIGRESSATVWTGGPR